MSICLRRREFIAGLGGAAAWPLAGRAQQRAMPVIGYLSSRTADSEVPMLASFRRGLGVGRSRSRSDRLCDCPDETDELTSHRRNGDVLELAPPEQTATALMH